MTMHNTLTDHVADAITTATQPLIDYALNTPEGIAGLMTAALLIGFLSGYDTGRIDGAHTGEYAKPTTAFRRTMADGARDCATRGAAFITDAGDTLAAKLRGASRAVADQWNDALTALADRLDPDVDTDTTTETLTRITTDTRRAGDTKVFDTTDD